MDPEHSIERIFHEALSLPPQERRAFVASACGTDVGRADRICRLLDAEAYMETRNDLQKGEPVGPYVVVRELGHGGMGSVYLAEQPVLDRRVALKVVRGDMESRFAVGRFLVEQHALAQLVHPNIATLYDVGVTRNGQPFFAMEYVDGEPIDAYCDRHQLTVEERLVLFQDLCAAVHFVHNHTVIHRDIKPGNVLVTDARQVKLLDFGLAKPLTAAPPSETIGAAWFTPAFASPEQIRRESLTLQSDGYALGVLLYCLLTGQLPFTGEMPGEMERAILQDEPQRPSLRVVQANVAERKKLEDAARVRHATPEQLSRSLRGDLDNIALKALEKDPGKRYKSADQLSEDIGRHLNNLPVLAQAPTWSYRTVKFVRRYRSGVIAAGVLAAVLAGSSIAVAWQGRVAHVERARAERRFNDVRHLANSFMFEFYKAIQDVPGTTSAQELVVSRALEYLNSLAQEVSDPELVRELATAYERVGDVQGDPYGQSLGQPQAALKSYETARDLRARLPESAVSRFDRARSHLKIADILWVQRKWTEARQNYELARQMDEAALRRDASNADVEQHLSLAYTGLGDTAVEVDDLASAKRFHQQSLAIRERLAASGTAPMRRNLAVGYVKLGDVLNSMGDLPGAIAQFKAALDIFRELAAKEQHNEQYRSNLTATWNRLGLVQLKDGSAADAVESQRQALRLANEAFLVDKSNATAKRNLASTESQLGDALLEAGSPAEAVNHLRAHLNLQRQLELIDGTNEQTRRDVWIAMYQLGKALLARGHTGEAHRMLNDSLERALDIAAKMPGDSRANDDLVDARVALARALRAESNLIGALDQFRQALSVAQKLVSDYPATTDYRSRLGLLLTELAATHEAAAVRMPARASEHRRLAKEAWRQSLDVYNAMARSGVLSRRDRQMLSQALQKAR